MTYLLTQDLVLSEQLYRIGQFLYVAVIANRNTKLLVLAGSADLLIVLPEGVCYHSRQIEIFQVIYHER
jgi:hypothetical protein